MNLDELLSAGWSSHSGWSQRDRHLSMYIKFASCVPDPSGRFLRPGRRSKVNRDLGGRQGWNASVLAVKGLDQAIDLTGCFSIHVSLVTDRTNGRRDIADRHFHRRTTPLKRLRRVAGLRCAGTFAGASCSHHLFFRVFFFRLLLRVFLSASQRSRLGI